MADNVTIAQFVAATDQVTGTGEHVQLTKLAYSADGSRTLAQVDANGVLVNIASVPSHPVTLASVPSHPVTNAGTFAVQAAATLAAETTKVIGTVNISAAQAVTANAGTNLNTSALALDATLTGRFPAAAALADAAANPTATAMGSNTLLYNGTTWDREHGNWRTTTGDTGAKLVTFNGATQTNFDAVGAWILIQLGTVSGTTPTLAVQLQVSFDAGTNWLALGPVLANLTASSQTGAIYVYPANISQAVGATPANLTIGATVSNFLNLSLPRTWRLQYTIGGTTPSFAITAVHVNYLR